jgi:hypothetical protein
MKLEDYNEYYIQGSDHYLIPKDVFKELFNEMINWKEESKNQKEVISRVAKYIENEMPYLQETDKEYEDVNGNTYFTYKEYDDKELLDILNEVSE